MTRSTRSKNSLASNRNYRESSVISIDRSDGESQDTNQDAPYELDSEYAVPLGHNLAPVAADTNKGKQRARNSGGAKDGDEDAEMLDIFGQEGGNEQAVTLQQEINEWARVQLEKIDADIEATNRRIADLGERKAKAEARAADSRTRFRLGYAGKKMGAYQLEKIRKTQTDAEATVRKTSDDLLRVQGKLTRLEELRDNVEFDTVRKFTEAKEKYRPRKPRKLGNRHYPPEHNLDLGDDSLSDAIRVNDEKERVEREKKGLSTNAKAPRACRRCKLGKQACHFIPGSASCNACALTGQRCRYKENFSGDKQIRPWLIHDKLDEIAALKAELAKYQEKSTVSVGTENPLSGITGYGPPTQKLARQNWALMVRGHPPRPPLPSPTAGDDSISTVKRKSPAESNDAEPSQPAKRQRQTGSSPSKQYSFQNETAETLAGPSKRGRKLGQTCSTRTTRPIKQQILSAIQEEQNQPSDPSAYPFTFRYPPEDSTNPTQPSAADQLQTNVVSVSNPKLWWAQTISDRGGQLPANILYMPDWPRWASRMNEKQELWFNALYSAGIQIPIVQGKSIEDDGGVEPIWPSWTRVEEELNETQKDHLMRASRGDFEIREFHDQEGIAQGTVDWQSADAQVQSRRQSPAQ